MDLDIKPDPDVLDSLSQTEEFVDETPSEQNGAHSAASSYYNLQLKVDPSLSESTIQCDTSYNRLQAVQSTTHPDAISSNINENPQIKVVPTMFLCSYPTGIIPSNKNSNQQKITAPSFTFNTSNVTTNPPPYNKTTVGSKQLYYSQSQFDHATKDVPTGTISLNISNEQQNSFNTIGSLLQTTSSENHSQVIHSATTTSSAPSTPRTEQSAVLIHELKQRVIRKDKGSKKNNKFTSHYKKKFLKAFQENGCSLSTIEKIVQNINVENIIEFYNNAAKEAQQYIHQECDSLSFNNITEWLKYLNTVGISKQCNYEAAIVLNVIANNEVHPEPKSFDGIDLKSIYTFLSNALMGLPQQQLNDASARFLSNEFENLINEANTDEADDDVLNMKRKIEKTLIHTINGKSYKLDPLNTDMDAIRRCYESIKK